MGYVYIVLCCALFKRKIRSNVKYKMSDDGVIIEKPYLNTADTYHKQ